MNRLLLNIALCLHKNASLVSHNKLLGFSIFDIFKPNFTKIILRLLLFHRSPNYSFTLFFDRIREIVHPELHIDIIHVAFYLNMFINSNNALKNILSSYELVINAVTHINNSLIDHVHISNSLLQKMHLENIIVCDVSFSDHETSH